MIEDHGTDYPFKRATDLRRPRSQQAFLPLEAPMKKLTALFVLCLTAGCQDVPPSPDDPADNTLPFDIVLNNGTVVDGLGNPRYRASIGIKGDRIVAISESTLDESSAHATVEMLLYCPAAHAVQFAAPADPNVSVYDPAEHTMQLVWATLP